MEDKTMKAAKKALARDTTKTEDAPSLYFTTGHTILDLVVGAGEAAGFGMGYLEGTIVRDHGDSGSSKSYKATECIAANYHKYKGKFRWRYCDPENGNTFDTQSLYGFDMFGGQEDYGRDVATVQDWDWDLNKWLDSLKPDECGVYVLDSLDSVTDCDTVARKLKRREAYDKDKEFDEGSYMMSMQKFLSQEFFRELTCKLKKKHAILYIISQERANVGAGMYAPKSRTSGGEALKFYESARIVSKLRQKDEIKDRAVSAIIQTTAEKVRHTRPFRKCFVTIHFTYGIDSLGDELDFLYNFRTPEGELKKKKDGALKVTWDDSEEMTRDELFKYIEEHKLRKEVKRRVIEAWEAIEDSIKIQRPAKFEED